MLDSKFKTKQQLLLHEKRRDEGTVFEMASGLSVEKQRKEKTSGFGICAELLPP